MSNRSISDKQNTIQALANPKSASGWLHKDGTQANRIDQLLLNGAIINDMAKDLIINRLGERDKITTIGRIRTHLSHLQREHKLLLKKENNFWKFDF